MLARPRSRLHRHDSGHTPIVLTPQLRATPPPSRAPRAAQGWRGDPGALYLLEQRNGTRKPTQASDAPVVLGADGFPRWSRRYADAWIGLLATHRRLTRELDAELEAAHGLTLSGLELLARLASAPERRLRLSVLAAEAGLSLSRVSRIVDALEGRGLIERRQCPEDARAINAQLTAPGLELARAAQATHLAAVRARFFDQLCGARSRRSPPSSGASRRTPAAPAPRGRAAPGRRRAPGRTAESKRACQNRRTMLGSPRWAPRGDRGRARSAAAERGVRRPDAARTGAGGAATRRRWKIKERFHGQFT